MNRGETLAPETATAYLTPMKQKNPSRGPSQRQLRVGEVVRRAVTDMLMRGDLFDPDLEGRSIIVTEAQPSPDLRNVTLYISVLGGKDEERVVKALERNANQIRREALADLGLRSVPRLNFQIDRTFDRMDTTTRMFADPHVRQDIAQGDEDDAED